LLRLISKHKYYRDTHVNMFNWSAYTFG